MAHVHAQSTNGKADDAKKASWGLRIGEMESLLQSAKRQKVVVVEVKTRVAVVFATLCGESAHNLGDDCGIFRNDTLKGSRKGAYRAERQR